MIDVGRANQGHALPGHGEDRTAGRRMEDADGAGEGETRERKDQMTAAQAAQTGRAAKLHAQVVRPCASGAEDNRGPDLGGPAGPARRLIAHDDTADLPCVAGEQALGAGIVQGHRAAVDCLAQDARRQPGIIRRGVDESIAAQQTLFRQDGAQLQQAAGVVVCVAPAQREQVVQDQADPKDPPGRTVTAKAGHEKPEGRYQSAALAQEPLTLGDRLHRQLDLRVCEVAQTAVDHLGRAARGPGAKVARLEEQGAQAGARRLAQDPGAGDAAAHNDHVPGAIELSPGFVTPSAMPHLNTSFARTLLYGVCALSQCVTTASTSAFCGSLWVSW